MTGPAARPPLMDLDEAIAQLLSKARPTLPVESVSTFEADGRVLAQDLVSALTVPPRDNSSMDGYAVRVADCAARGAELAVSQRIPAGSVGTPLAAGNRRAHLHRRADSRGRRRGRDAGRHRCTGQRRARSHRTRARRGPMDPPRRRRRDPRRGRAGPRRTPYAGRTGVGGERRLRSPAGRAPARVALLSTGDELAMPGEVAPEAIEARRDLQLQPLFHARAAAPAGLRGERPRHRGRQPRGDDRRPCAGPPKATT